MATLTTSPPDVRVLESSDELTAERDQAVMAALRTVFPEMMLLGAVIPAVQLALAPGNVREFLAISAGISAAVLFLIGYWVRQQTVSDRWAHPVGFLIAMVLLTRDLFQFHFALDYQQTINIALLLFGAARVLLSVRWFGSVLAISLLGWAAIALMAPSVGESLFFGAGLMVAAIAATKVQDWRWAKLRGQHRARLEREQERLELEQKEQRQAHAVLGADDGLWYWDLKRDEVEFSPQWVSMLGYKKGDVGSSPNEWFSRVHPYYLAGLKMDLSAHLNGQTPRFESEYRIRRKDGSYLWVLCRGLAIRDKDGSAVSIAGSQTDISRLIDIEQRLLHDALHDRLTGLPNRNYLMARLETAIERRKQGQGDLFALIFLDLDRFKVINDSLGHLFGDQLLAAAASRLRGCQRSGDTVARLGGDEFVILMENLTNQAQAQQGAARIRKVLAVPFKLGDQEVVTTASIGIAFGGAAIEHPEDMLRNADIAMYEAKNRMKDQKERIQVFNSEMHERTVKTWQVQNDLRRALEREELLLHYQPLISLSTGRITGLEALLRWQRANGEVLSAIDFIALAEEMGLIVEIGEWVLRTACLQNKAWQEAGILPRRVSVNLSARQLRQKGFADVVKRVLNQTQLAPEWLELEITESALMHSVDEVPVALRTLAEMGIRLSIDDFGTGYSALSYLKQYSFDTLKIPQCFVAGVPHDEKAAAVTKGLISLAHSLDLEVTAEGVETSEQVEFLREYGCDKIQGFLASRPLVSAEIAELIKADAGLLPDGSSDSPAMILEAVGRLITAESSAPGSTADAKR